MLLKRPDRPSPLEVRLYIPPQSPARRIEISLDGTIVAETTFTGPGTYTLTSQAVTTASESASVTVTADKSFSVPGDQRQLSVILTAVGFKPTL